MTAYQGRVWAENPDDAAIRIREKHAGCKGDLIIKETHIKGWYEYVIFKVRGDRHVGRPEQPCYIA